MDPGDAEQFERVIEHRAAMRKCDCRMVMKTTQDGVSIEPAETGDVRCAGAPECFRIKIEKVPLGDIGL